MAWFMKMGPRCGLEAKIGLQFANFSYVIELALRRLISNRALEPLRNTLVHISYGIIHEHIPRVGSRSQNRPQMTDFSYYSHKIEILDIELAFLDPFLDPKLTL